MPDDMTAMYDDIIVGAGSSGAVLAARLSEDPDRRVLLLEGGPDYRSPDQVPENVRRINTGLNASLPGHDWGLKATAGPGREIDYPRGFISGGSSAINGAVAIRGMPADFDEWASLGNDGWAWSDVLPYFNRLETDRDVDAPFHGQSGPISISRFTPGDLLQISRAFLGASADLGYPQSMDFNDPVSTGAGIVPMNREGDIRISTALGYLQPARGRSNLTIRGDCLVDRVLFDRLQANGVEVIIGTRRQRCYGQRITLAAGAIMSPAILMRSGIGPVADLKPLGIRMKVDLPGVGANLIDHPRCHIFFARTATPGDVQASVIQVGIRYTSIDSRDVNDMQMYLFAPLQSGMIGLAGDAAGSDWGAFLTSFQKPQSRGRVSLNAADPAIQPAIALNYLDDAEDLRRTVEGLRDIWRFVTSPRMAPFIEHILPNPFNGVIPDEALIKSDTLLTEYARQTVTTSFHPVGTARMGPDDDEMAVVDQYCRVRGVENLRVVDASVMPTIPRANTNLTCIMIGERVADWMR